MSTEINIKKRITALDESVILTNDINSIDFVGTGVVASTIGDDVTVTINENVLFFNSYSAFPVTGLDGYMYVDNTTNQAYLWDSVGLAYVLLNAPPIIPPDPSPIAFANAVTQAVLLYAPIYYNGPANDGVGATLTATANGIVSDGSLPNKIDTTYTPIATDIVLVKNQVAQLQNGLYEITIVGSASTTYLLTRVGDYDETLELYPLQVNVLPGGSNGLTLYNQTTVNPIVGTSNIVFLTTSASNGYVIPTYFVDTVTTAALPTCVYANGTIYPVTIPGYLATLTASVNGALGTINGLTANVSTTPALSFSRILVKNQLNPAHNGTYVVINAGSATTKWILRRIHYAASSFDRYSQNFMVSNTGSTKIGKYYFTSPNVPVLTNATVGTAAINILEYGGSSAIPQANKIYVDSINGINSTGIGNINNPYLTVEYALADITNTGTVTATTANSSATLTAVSSTANILVGQYITGTGIPYGSTVVSKTVNTIGLSKKCTAFGTITATYWTPYLLMLNGNFVATGNWQKQGFTFNCLNSTISWGAFNLFELNTSQLVPFSVIGGNWNGTSASSRFLFNSTYSGSSADFIFKPFYFYSIGTGYSIELQQNGVYKFNNFTLECPNYICAFGSIADFESIGTVTVSGYFYSLLQGFLIRYCTFNVFGKLESPSSVNIINNTQSATIISNAVIVGSLSGVYGVFNGNIYGTTLTNTGGSYYVPATYNGGVQISTFTNSGFAIINGQMLGNVVNNGSLGNIIINDMIGTYTGSSSSKGTVRASSDVGNTFSATLSGTSELTVLDTRFMINAVSGYTIGVGCTLYNKGYFRGGIGTMAGTLINEGNMTILDISTITGTFKNFAYINLARTAAESVANTPTIAVSTGTLILNAGSQLECQLADSKSGLIRKTASGGKVVILGQPYFKVANGLAPLQILSNTGTAQDVLNFGLIDNCAVGFRLANTFTDTTYGVAYAPNILGGGTNYEDTTYSF